MATLRLCVTSKPAPAMAIVGDRGLAEEIGEGTVALAAQLGKVALKGDETCAAIKGLARPRVVTLIFKGKNVRKKPNDPISAALINQSSNAAYKAWGGGERLAARIAANKQ